MLLFISVTCWFYCTSWLSVQGSKHCPLSGSDIISYIQLVRIIQVENRLRVEYKKKYKKGMTDAGVEPAIS